MGFNFEVIKRPNTFNSKIDQDLVKALLQTLNTKDCVKFTVTNESEYTNWGIVMRQYLKKTRNLRLRTRRNKINNQVICWVEKYDQRELELPENEDFGVINGNQTSGTSENGAANDVGEHWIDEEGEDHTG